MIKRVHEYRTRAFKVRLTEFLFTELKGVIIITRDTAFLVHIEANT